jgi:hypothetical protein
MTMSSAESKEPKSWKVNRPAVSAELIGTEMVAIHLPTGIYFSMDTAAADVWAGIEQNQSFDRLVDLLTAAYEVESNQAVLDLTAFLDQLLQEDLVQEAPAAEATPSPAPTPRKTYPGLKLEKFADLQYLLMIDPVHEVDQHGWPRAKGE